jgi:hypothetical protein
MASIVFKQLIIWGPIVVGLFHQLLMLLKVNNRLPVFVDPPGYIYPFVTLEWTWWLVLLFLSGVIALLIYAGRLQSLPARMVYPLYIYIIYLLIFIQPI